MKKINQNFGCQELSQNEELGLRGGETLWYWGFYILGEGARFIQGALENPPKVPPATIYK
jgi:hypothetical protein